MYQDIFSKNEKRVPFKKRAYLNINKIKYKNSVTDIFNNNKKKSIFLYNFIYVEIKIFKKILVFLKRMIKKKKIKFFIFIKLNHKVTGKNKNARMGKGKGRVKRFIFLNKVGSPIINVVGLTSLRLNYLICFLKKINYYFY